MCKLASRTRSSGVLHLLAPLLTCALALPAWAQAELPPRKPGMWVATVELPQRPGRTMNTEQCIDAATDAAMQRRMLAGDALAQCQYSQPHKTAQGLELSSTCATTQGKRISQVQFTGDARSRYTIRIATRFEPPLPGYPEARRVIKARWAGACPADLKPGQMRIDGKVVSGLGSAG